MLFWILEAVSRSLEQLPPTRFLILRSVSPSPQKVLPVTISESETHGIRLRSAAKLCLVWTTWPTTGTNTQTVGLTDAGYISAIVQVFRQRLIFRLVILLLLMILLLWMLLLLRAIVIAVEHHILMFFRGYFRLNLSGSKFHCRRGPMRTFAGSVTARHPCPTLNRKSSLVVLRAICLLGGDRHSLSSNQRFFSITFFSKLSGYSQW